MQIHEITRKPIKEDVVSGLTNMLYKSAGVANPLAQDTGTPVAGNLRQGAAGEMNNNRMILLANDRVYPCNLLIFTVICLSIHF